MGIGIQAQASPERGGTPAPGLHPPPQAPAQEGKMKYHTSSAAMFTSQEKTTVSHSIQQLQQNGTCFITFAFGVRENGPGSK